MTFRICQPFKKNMIILQVSSETAALKSYIWINLPLNRSKMKKYEGGLSAKYCPKATPISMVRTTS